MSEYINVEHPFLEKLREIGWQIMEKDDRREKVLEKYENVKKWLMERMLNEKCEIL